MLPETEGGLLPSPGLSTYYEDDGAFGNVSETTLISKI